MQSTCTVQVHAGYRSVCEVRNAQQSLLLTCQHRDPAEGGFPESTCAPVPLAQEHPWECCIQGKHSALEHCQTPDHGTISPLSGRSSWGLHTHSLLVCMSCRFKKWRWLTVCRIVSSRTLIIQCGFDKNKQIHSLLHLLDSICCLRHSMCVENMLCAYVVNSVGFPLTNAFRCSWVKAHTALSTFQEHMSG